MSVVHDSFPIRSVYPKKGSVEEASVDIIFVKLHEPLDKLTLPYFILELYSYGDSNDIEAFSRLRSLVNNPDLDLTGLSPSPSAARTYPNNSVPAPNHYQHSFSSSPRPGQHNMAPNVNGTGPSMYNVNTFSSQSSQKIRDPPI